MRPLERIHIFGAAGCGSSTLGRALARRLGCQLVDADDVFWLPTLPPYQMKRPVAERIQLLDEATRWERRWVLSGSIIGWGEPLVSRLDLVVFLYVPPEVRLTRLKERERGRFGDMLDPGGSMHGQHQAFLRWAAGYDTGTSGRTLETDANWLAHLDCPAILMTRETPVDDQIGQIISSWRHSQ